MARGASSGNKVLARHIFQLVASICMGLIFVGLCCVLRLPLTIRNQLLVWMEVISGGKLIMRCGNNMWSVTLKWVFCENAKMATTICDLSIRKSLGFCWNTMMLDDDFTSPRCITCNNNCGQEWQYSSNCSHLCVSAERECTILMG